MSYLTSSLLSNQIFRNQLLQKEIVRYNNQIEELINLLQLKEKLISRISLIHKAQSMRILSVHLFDELIKVIPKDVYLSNIKSINTLISVKGYARSNILISEIIKNMEHDDWFKQPILQEIKKIDDKKQVADNVFKLTFMLGAPNDAAN